MCAKPWRDLDAHIRFGRGEKVAKAMCWGARRRACDYRSAFGI